MPWLQLGFVGLLEVEQTLILWDRILGISILSNLVCGIYSRILQAIWIQRYLPSLQPLYFITDLRPFYRYLLVL